MLHMELKNVNLNSGNVVANNIINIDFFIFENCENWVQEWRSHVIFLNDAMIAQKQNSSYCSPQKSTLNVSKLPM
jgi:hypothetical protein